MSFRLSPPSGRVWLRTVEEDEPAMSPVRAPHEGDTGQTRRSYRDDLSGVSGSLCFAWIPPSAALVHLHFHLLLPHVWLVWSTTISVLKQHQRLVPQIYAFVRLTHKAHPSDFPRHR
ncbi:unnamed protein product [Durusdinium trenchii]|uniref:Uncharacterized protein n=1 Tax=Durusdinium trenchii TaxID=1381693 RepID=A0ABP0SQD7_9DINO